MNFQIFSIILEAIVFILCLDIAVRKKKLFAYGFALTFFIYVFYDFIIYFGFAIASDILRALLFLAVLFASFGAILLHLEEGFKAKENYKIKDKKK
jgi:hypothetical protein